jgi:hypothetical protein
MEFLGALKVPQEISSQFQLLQQGLSNILVKTPNLTAPLKRRKHLIVLQVGYSQNALIQKEKLRQQQLPLPATVVPMVIMLDPLGTLARVSPEVSNSSLRQLIMRGRGRNCRK